MSMTNAPAANGINVKSAQIHVHVCLSEVKFDLYVSYLK